MSANSLEIRGLSKSFSTFNLGPLDLTVPMGAIYGFVGPNGSGKTTTLDLIFFIAVGLALMSYGVVSGSGPWWFVRRTLIRQTPRKSD